MPDASAHRLQILHEERDAAERPMRGIRGGGARLLEQRCHHGVQLRVETFDASDGGVDELDRLDLASSHELSLRGGIERCEVVHSSLLRRSVIEESAMNDRAAFTMIGALTLVVVGLVGSLMLGGGSRPATLDVTALPLVNACLNALSAGLLT